MPTVHSQLMPRPGSARLEVPQPSEPATPAVPEAPIAPVDPDPGTPADPAQPAEVPPAEEPATPIDPDPQGRYGSDAGRDTRSVPPGRDAAAVTAAP